MPRAAGYVRHLLVAHGALAERNESIARLEQWINTAVAAIDDAEHRRVVQTFATWQTMRRLRRRAARTAPARRSATRYSRNQVAAAITFLGWHDEHDLALTSCTQDHVDIWLTTGPASRRDVRHFLAWTAQQGLTTTFTITTPSAHDGDALDANDRWTIARRLLHDASLQLGDRVAGSFVLLYAQPLSHVAVMTHQQITTTSGTVGVQFGRHPIEVPAPLDQLVATLAHTGRRPHTSIGAPTTSPWLFPGHLPRSTHHRRPPRRPPWRTRHRRPSRAPIRTHPTRRRTPRRRPRRHTRHQNRHSQRLGQDSRRRLGQLCRHHRTNTTMSP